MNTNLLSFYPEKDVQEYKEWKNKIYDSKFPGSTELIDRLNSLENRENAPQYLETLVEFNVGRILYLKNIQFGYELQQFEKIDFVFNKILLEVKSIGEKGYERDEKKQLQEAKKISQPGIGSLQKIKILRKDAKIDSEVELSWFTYPSGVNVIEQLESGQVLKSDMAHEGRILEYTADFQEKTNSLKDARNYKKAIFFFGQSDDASYVHVENVARWYFGLKPFSDNTTVKYYPGMFRTKDGKVISKGGTISAFIFLGALRNLDIGNLLVWSNNLVKKNVIVWTNKNEELKKNLTDLFRI